MINSENNIRFYELECNRGTKDTVYQLIADTGAGQVIIQALKQILDSDRGAIIVEKPKR